ncbi:MAG: hypothetical protein ACFB0B_05860 [Thermonemataceae bacterium]
MRLLRSYYYVLLSLWLFAACQDPRGDQRDDNLFDPANAFIRFNYEDDLIGTALDTLSISGDNLDEVIIPIALSSPPQEVPIAVTYEQITSEGIMEGVHFEIRDDTDNLIDNNTLVLTPGDFDVSLVYRPLAAPTASLSYVTFRLITLQPEVVGIGFPGSQRGSTFTLRIE